MYDKRYIYRQFGHIDWNNCSRDLLTTSSCDVWCYRFNIHVVTAQRLLESIVFICPSAMHQRDCRALLPDSYQYLGDRPQHIWGKTRLLLKIGFIQKALEIFSNFSKCHPCEPKIIPELWFPVNIINKMMANFWIDLVIKSPHYDVHRVLGSCGFQWCGFHSCAFSKSSQIYRLCNFHYISEGIPSLMLFWLLLLSKTYLYFVTSPQAEFPNNNMCFWLWLGLFKWSLVGTIRFTCPFMVS